MNVIVTGAYGKCGTAIIDYLHDRSEYDFTYLNRSDRSEDHEYGGYDTVVADIREYDALEAAFEDQDTVVHLAADPDPASDWEAIHEANVVGTYNALEAARRAEVDSFIFASSNHVMGGYEDEHAPELYELGHDLLLDHTSPVRPDSYYGLSKAMGEDMGRYYVDYFDYPTQFYALRICSLRWPDYDHPFGFGERRVDHEGLDRDSEQYREFTRRMKATWHSRRDFAHQIDCCLQDENVNFGVFAGVSDNLTRWFDLEHARKQIGYNPQDDGSEWDQPPE